MVNAAYNISVIIILYTKDKQIRLAFELWNHQSGIPLVSK